MTIKPSIRKIINEIIEKWKIKLSIAMICELWDKPHRHYHTTENHLIPMLEDIVNFRNDNGLDQNSFEILIVSALFHDLVYDSKSIDNEYRSMLEFKLHTNINDDKVIKVCEIIEMTKTHQPKDKIEELFSMFDLKVLNLDLKGLLRWEDQISKEFEWVNWKIYKDERIKVINYFLDRRDTIDVNWIGLQQLIDIIENKNPKIGIYAGSFNTFTIAHQNIFEKSELIFDKVIIAKGKNDTKSINIDEYNRELNNLIDLYPTKEIISYSGLLTNLINEQTGNITLIRGLRNGYDLDAENTMITYMKDMLPELKVVYIPCDKKYEHISSSAIRSIRIHGDELS